MRRSVERYCNAALPLMHLPHWRVRIASDIPADDSWADIEVSTNLWLATIRISDDFFRQEPELQRRIVAHELLHIHNAPLERLIESLDGVLGSQAYEMLDHLWDAEGERIAEALSFVVAERLPLPKFRNDAK
jgi:hypothetical protein